jgi:hypothetical protein
MAISAETPLHKCCIKVVSNCALHASPILGIHRNKGIPHYRLWTLLVLRDIKDPNCLDSRLTDARRRVTPQKHYFSVSGTHFC